MDTDIPVFDPVIQGSKYRKIYQFAVAGVLGNRAPPVSSFGTRFYNVDHWTGRALVCEMCAWARKNPECIPTRDDIDHWVRAANKKVFQREIVIANTPDQLPVRVAMALLGGAYHESFHTEYSCTRQLTVDEVADIVVTRWAKVPDWSKVYMHLQNWGNIIEDIRIERLGRVDFPGVEQKLYDLQDFILNQEAKGLSEVRGHDGKPPRQTALNIVMATFRDVGLGYPTKRQREALTQYQTDNPDAVAFVIGQGKGNPGPLTGLLKEAIALSKEDDLGCIRLAMDVLSVLYAESKDQDPADDPENTDHQRGKGKSSCPECGARGSKLVVRPKADGLGGKDPGQGILTCTVCGFQTEVEIGQSDAKEDSSQLSPEDAVRFEDFDLPTSDASKDKSSSAPVSDQPEQNNGDSDDQAGGPDDQASDSDGQAGGSDEGDSDDQAGDSDEVDSGDQAGDSDGGGSDDQVGGSDDQVGGSDDSTDDPAGRTGNSDGSSQAGNSDEQGSGRNPIENPDEHGDGAGGHYHDSTPCQGNDWSDLADDVLNSGEYGLHDNNSALEAEIKGEVDGQVRREGGLKKGEALWKPFSTSHDQFLVVDPSNNGRDHDRKQADRLYASVQMETTYLRTRLRQLVRAIEMSSVMHGTRRGRRISARFMVDSKVALMSGQYPQRAFKQIDSALDTSLAAAIVLDESGSMHSLLKEATRVLCAITEPLDALGCSVQVSGFRNGQSCAQYKTEDDDGTYHRIDGVVHDIFKMFHEPLRAVKWRFSNTRSCGGTPMADGIQFGLDSLSSRKEGHRILFVVTDGRPDSGHDAVIRRQLRLAHDAGIHVIGVGLGRTSRYVQELFPDSVWTEKVSDMPQALVTKLNDLVDVRVLKRGRRLAND